MRTQTCNKALFIMFLEQGALPMIVHHKTHVD